MELEDLYIHAGNKFRIQSILRGFACIIIYIYIWEMQLRPFFPLIIFILLCFNVLSTVPRKNRLADFLYIYIFFFISVFKHVLLLS